MQPDVTTQELLQAARGRLTAAGIETARLDAEVLLMHLLGVDRAGLYRSYPEPVPSGVAQAYAVLLDRRLAGEPVAYLTGRREFMGLEFLVDPRVLIPRPETEYLVEWALARMRGWSAEASRRVVVDVGTGSGAIAVSLGHLMASTSPALVVGSDRSVGALQVAAQNRQRLAPGRVALVAGDLLTWCRSDVQIDVILANLPYLKAEQAHQGIAQEPATALYAGVDGFDLYRELLPQARQRLAPDGALICEIDPSQRAVALMTARRSFPFASIEVRPDLAGLDRYLVIDHATG